MKKESVLFSIRIPAALLKVIDKAAAKQDRSRNNYINVVLKKACKKNAENIYRTE